MAAVELATGYSLNESPHPKVGKLARIQLFDG